MVEMSGFHTGMRTEEYNQMVVVPAMVVGQGKRKECAQAINEYVRESGIPLKHDLILVGDVETTHELDDGDFRIDTMLLIHYEDIGAFAHARFGLSMPFRWLEDVLGNDMERGAQTYADGFLRHYPPMWEYGETKWADYPCYTGNWAGGAQ